MSCNASNVKIEPCDAYYEASEALCVDFKGKIAADLDGKYINVYGSDGTQYAVWFDVDNLSTAPTVPGATLVEVDINTGDLGAAIATAFAAVTIGTYTASQDGTVVVLVNGDQEEVATDADKGTTELVVNVITKGGNLDLGLMDGDITWTPTTEKVSITAHQTGTTPINQVFQGVGMSVELTLLELTRALYDAMIKLSGGAVLTPSGGTQVSGFGTGIVGSSAIVKSRTLRLHPVSKQAADKSGDYYFWKASPEIGGVTISGENPQTMPLTFTCYADETKLDAINIMVHGDGTQTGLNK